jgi:hypothetical protein
VINLLEGSYRNRLGDMGILIYCNRYSRPGLLIGDDYPFPRSDRFSPGGIRLFKNRARSPLLKALATPFI